MYASETIQNCKNPTGHIDTLNSFNIDSTSTQQISKRFEGVANSFDNVLQQNLMDVEAVCSGLN